MDYSFPRGPGPVNMQRSTDAANVLRVISDDIRELADLWNEGGTSGYVPGKVAAIYNKVTGCEWNPLTPGFMSIMPRTIIRVMRYMYDTAVLTPDEFGKIRNRWNPQNKEMNGHGISITPMMGDSGLNIMNYLPTTLVQRSPFKVTNPANNPNVQFFEARIVAEYAYVNGDARILGAPRGKAVSGVRVSIQAPAGALSTHATFSCFQSTIPCMLRSNITDYVAKGYSSPYLPGHYPTDMVRALCDRVSYLVNQRGQDRVAAFEAVIAEMDVLDALGKLSIAGAPI